MTDGYGATRFSIAVPVWPPSLDRSLLRHSLARLFARFKDSAEMIGVMNGGRLEDWLAVLPAGSRSRWALLSENVGVARAWNIGASLALGTTLVFTNQDADVDPEDLLRMEMELRDESVAVAGARGAYWGSGGADGFHHLGYYSGTTPADVDLVSGFLFAVRRSRWMALGGVDETLTPFSGEEVDVALKIRSSGLRARALGRFGTRHRFAISAAPGRWAVHALGGLERIDSVSVRNRAYLAEKYEAIRDGSFLGASTITAQVLAAVLPRGFCLRIAAGPEGGRSNGPTEANTLGEWQVVSIEETERDGLSQIVCSVRTAAGSSGLLPRALLARLCLEGETFRRFGPGVEFRAEFFGGQPERMSFPLRSLFWGCYARLRRQLRKVRRA